MNEYAASLESPYHISCASIVYRRANKEYEYCLLHRDNSFQDANTWHFPGGTLHTTETLEQCVSREIREESGVTAEIVAYLGGLRRQFKEMDDPRTFDKITHFFLCHYQNTTDTFDHEHSQVAWFSYSESFIKISATHKEFAEILTRAKSYLEKEE